MIRSVPLRYKNRTAEFGILLAECDRVSGESLDIEKLIDVCVTAQKFYTGVSIDAE